MTLLHVCGPDYSLPTSSLQQSQGSVKAPFHGSDLSARQNEDINAGAETLHRRGGTCFVRDGVGQ